MDLHIVQMFHLHAVDEGDGERIARKMAEIGGIFIQSAHAARGEQGEIRVHVRQFSVLRTHHAAEALVALGDDVDKLRMLADLHVGQGAHQRQKLARDLLARNVVVEENARARMPALAREAEIPLFVPRELHPVFHKLGDHRGGKADHLLDRRRVVLIVTGAQGVVEVTAEILLAAQHADAALREEGIALVRSRLGEHQNAHVPRQVQRAAQPRHARARDEHIVFLYRILHTVFPFLRRPILRVRAYARAGGVRRSSLPRPSSPQTRRRSGRRAPFRA